MCWVGARLGGDVKKPGRYEERIVVWNAEGEQAFEYEAVEVLDEDVHALNVFGVLKEMKGKWVAELKAEPLL